MEYSEHRHT
nr:unnamed protein product [Callosobruchus chinensis]CAH7751401.1 unnamed protein product [Callosobruchus chinensis]